MKNKIIFHALALEEFKEASIWYELQKTGLGFQFENAVETKLNQINETPLVFGRKTSNFREALLDGFPYVIVYKHNNLKNEIYISSIYHTSRNPKGKHRNL